MYGQFYTPKTTALSSYFSMSEFEYDTLKAALFAAWSQAEMMVKYNAPLEDRKVQLADVAQAVVRLFIGFS